MLRVAAIVVLVGCQSADVSRRLGARCDVTADCAQKCQVPSGAWPGGFCTTACTADGDCGDGARCIDEDGGICAFVCATDPDCGFLGEGYTCMELDDHGAKATVCRGM